MESKILIAEGVKELEKINLNSNLINEGIKKVERYFSLEPLHVELLNNVYINYFKGLELISIEMHNYIQIIIDKSLNIIYSYIKKGGAWQELEKEQAKRILYKVYSALGKKQLKQEKESNIQSKYNLIGYLLKYKLNYKNFISWEYTVNNFIRFNFINKEGYKRSWLTSKKNIIEYFNYNNSDIKQVLFDL